jgi:hypothetical protein
MAIRFTLPEPLFSGIPNPVPASDIIPDWWADTPVALKDDYGEIKHSGTVRGCMPFLNAMTMGWVLRAPQDLSIRSDGSGLRFDYGDIPDTPDPIKPFTQGQLPRAPDNLPESIIPLKLNTYWFIDGHPGSKAWVMPPRNRFQESNNDIYFSSGVYNINSTYVDSGIVAFLDPKEGLNLHIKAGTPLAQVMLLDDDGLVDEASVVPMTKEMEHDRDVAKTKMEVSMDQYREELWDPIGRAKRTPTNEDSTCPFGYGGNG